MEKEKAIKIIKENNTMTLIETLLRNNQDDKAMSLIQCCWGFSDSDVIEYIEEDWEY